jgi:hypothetical protein
MLLMLSLLVVWVVLTSSCDAGYMERYNKSLAREAVGAYVEVASKYGLTPTELALAWCNQRWNVTSSIIGATSMEQLKVRSICSNNNNSSSVIIVVIVTRPYLSPKKEDEKDA